jgi:hypothetical protein
MTIFNMSLNVPEFMPVIGQSLVYLDVGVNGILVAVDGQIEINGVINTVSELAYSSIFVCWMGKLIQLTDELSSSIHL